MRRWMLDAPRWVLALVAGIPFGLSQALSTRFVEDTSWTYALVAGAVAGLFFGAFLSVVLHRMNRQVREAVGELPETQLKHATRASWRGPVPEDATTREAAHRLLVSQLGQARRQRVWVVPLVVFMGALTVYLAGTDSPWWWPALALWAVLAIGHLWWPVRLQRRVRLLEGKSPLESAGT